MTSLLGQLVLLIVFSLALAVVASAYRDDEPRVVLKGILRRTLLFGGSVALLGATSLILETLLLRP
ncbi:MAG TPA: hypothetical protein VGC54_14685 [Planctomycetota bacterium]